MKKKILLKLLVLISCVTVGSYYIAYQLVDYFMELNKSELTTDISVSQLVKSAYAPIFSLLLFMLVLPVFLWDVPLKQIRKLTWWKFILLLEGIGILLALIYLSHDTLSMLLFIGLWQLAVLVNFLVWRKVHHLTSTSL